jgi:hypothetical protein
MTQTTDATQVKWDDLPRVWLTALVDTLSQDTMPGHDIISTTGIVEMTTDRLRMEHGNPPSEDMPDGIVRLTALVEDNERTYQSDGSPKGSITTSDGPVDELRGVYILDLLRDIQRGVDAEYRSALGRGTEAHRLIESIRETING